MQFRLKLKYSCQEVEVSEKENYSCEYENYMR